MEFVGNERSNDGNQIESMNLFYPYRITIQYINNQTHDWITNNVPNDHSMNLNISVLLFPFLSCMIFYTNH